MNILNLCLHQVAQYTYEKRTGAAPDDEREREGEHDANSGPADVDDGGLAGSSGHDLGGSLSGGGEGHSGGSGSGGDGSL